MERYQKNMESSGQASEQQQPQLQIFAKQQPCSFLQPTTPVWGDRNMSEQSAEETNNSFSYTLPRLLPSMSDARIPTYNPSSSKNNSLSSLFGLTENIMNNQSSNEVQLPRKCKLCAYVAKARTEYIDHMITHCIFTKSSYVEDDNLNEYVDDEELDDSGNESHSKGKKKIKVFQPRPCSKCGFNAKTKLALWLHLRQHFTQEECSGFVCTSCPFATTLKHHMTFHWFSAHDDFKAFMCTECSYACVSKSMLTSHMKTHSEVYQYNCGNCTYKTKFCNAMKKHLKDNDHKAGIVLNPDGTPNPFATIDVYGNKRGPKQKPFIEEKKELTKTIEYRPSTSRMTPPLVPSIPISSASVLSTAILDLQDSNAALLSPFQIPSQRSPVRIPLFQKPPFQISAPFLSDSNSLVTTTWLNNFLNKMYSEGEINLSNGLLPLSNNNSFNLLCGFLIRDIASRDEVDEKEQRQVCRLLASAYRYLVSDQERVKDVSSTGAGSDDTKSINEPSTSTLVSEPQSEEDEILDQPLDLSMSAMSKEENQPQFQESVSSFSRRKRKSKATKLEYVTNEKKFHTDDNATQTWNTNQICTESSLPTLLTASRSDLQEKNETPNMINMYKTSFTCYYCHIIFANDIMYAVHMSFHENRNPFTCALCNQNYTDQVSFFLHLIRTKH